MGKGHLLLLHVILLFNIGLLLFHVRLLLLVLVVNPLTTRT
jgi:hypothetical protein